MSGKVSRRRFVRTCAVGGCALAAGAGATALLRTSCAQAADLTATMGGIYQTPEAR